MSNQQPPLISVKSLKRQAQRAAKKYKSLGTKVSHSQCLEEAAQQHGFRSYNDYLERVRECEVDKRHEHCLSPDFTKCDTLPIQTRDSALQSSTDTKSNLGLSKEPLIDANSKFLVRNNTSFAVIWPTETGLSKSILDATQEVRSVLLESQFHDYSSQQQGPEAKVIRSAVFVSPNHVIETVVSLYRPNTKRGDPRIWISGLSKLTAPELPLALIPIEGTLYVLPLALSSLDAFGTSQTKIDEIVAASSSMLGEVASDLIHKLRRLARNKIVSERYGDTAVGNALETALGIKQNSAKTPDYNGIEIKAGRRKKLQNRSNLFAQVPDWKLSSCKRSAEILSKYGYARGEDFKLYCTVSALEYNSQGLKLSLDESRDLLVEEHITDGPIAVWPGQLLRARLLEKHAETFWVDVITSNLNGKEAFELRSVLHTRKPMSHRLLPLIGEGVITMDHLIKQNGKTKRVSEKGPLFKIHKNNLALLFPDPIEHSLI